MKNILLTLVILFTSLIFLLGQNTEKIFHMGTGIPVGLFASKNLNNENACAANVGFNTGLQIRYPFKESGKLGLFGGFDFFYNSLRKSVQEEIKKSYIDAGLYQAEFEFFKYLSYPISAGVFYKYEIAEWTMLYGKAAICANFLQMTDYNIFVNLLTLERRHYLSNGLGFMLGFDILYNDKTNLSLNYYGFKHKVSGIIKLAGLSDEFEFDVNVNIISLTFGLKF